MNNNDFSKLLRRKTALHLGQLKMLYFLNPESDVNLDQRKLSSIAKSLIFKPVPMDSAFLPRRRCGGGFRAHENRQRSLRRHRFSVIQESDQIPRKRSSPMQMQR